MINSSLESRILRSGASVEVTRSSAPFCALWLRLTCEVCSLALESALFALIAAFSCSSTVSNPPSISFKLIPSSPRNEPRKLLSMPRTSTPFSAAWNKPRPLRFMYAVLVLPRKYTPISSSPVRLMVRARVVLVISARSANTVKPSVNTRTLF